MTLNLTNYNYFHSKNKNVQNRLINRNNYTYQSILKLIDRFFKEQGSVLDIGCGVGLIDFYLAKKGYKVTAIDISSRAIDLAKESAINLGLKNVDFHVRNVENELVEKKYDFIICSEVIEHVLDPTALLSKIFSISTDNTVIIISAPISQSPLYKIGFLNVFDHEVGHLRRYSQESLVELLQSLNFRVEYKARVEGLLRNSLYTVKSIGWFIRFIRWPFSIVVNLLDNLSGQLFGYSNIYLVVRKK